MIDARSRSPEKLVPPAPLPYVSRRQLAKVGSPLPPPTACRYCGSPVRLGTHAEVYQGRSFGDWPYVYRCVEDRCGAYVGLHPKTDLPLGTLADARLREARRRHKAPFVSLKRLMGWSDHQAYAWLADRLGIPLRDCHWSWFEVNDCQAAGALCREALAQGGV